MIPPYFLQMSIGIYIIEVIFILSSVLVTINSGDDKLKKTSDTGRNLMAGILLYLTVALISSFILSILAGVALAGI